MSVENATSWARAYRLAELVANGRGWLDALTEPTVFNKTRSGGVVS